MNVARGPIVVDPDVFGAELVPDSPNAERYEPILAGRVAMISFETVAGLRFGALRRGWGDARLRRLDALIQRAAVVHTGPDLVEVHAQLRTSCEAAGHPLAQQVHNADRWIAATAIRHAIPLVSTDRILRGVPGLVLETAPDSAPCGSGQYSCDELQLLTEPLLQQRPAETDVATEAQARQLPAPHRLVHPAHADTEELRSLARRQQRRRQVNAVCALRAAYGPGSHARAYGRLIAQIGHAA